MPYSCLKKPEHIIVISFLFFMIISSLCFIMSSDDFLWTGYSSIRDMIERDNQNGRFFTNSITYLMVNFFPLRIALYVLFMMTSFFSFRHIIDSDKNHFFFASVIVVLGFLTLDKEIANSTLRWISGFSNYVISGVITCVCICYFQPLFTGKEIKSRKYNALLFLILGLSGSLCLENITIYNFILGLFFIVLSLRNNRKIDVTLFSFLIGTIIGMVLMFSHSSYHSIFFHGKDILGYRAIDLDPFDIIYKVYREIIPLFAKQFYFSHILIASSLIVIYIRKYSDSSVKVPKYLLSCIYFISSFAVYSLFNVLLENLVSLTPSYKTASIETAFTALYIFALIYACYNLLDKALFIKAIFLLISALFVTAPFLVVSPVSSRCFYNVFIFWFLLAGMLSVYAIESISISTGCIYLKRISVCCVTVFMLLSSYISINNKYIDNCRIQYINKQLEENTKNIYFLKLPYPNYSPDTLLERLNDPSNVYYYRLICNYYDFDPDIADKHIIELYPIDYFQMQE